MEWLASAALVVLAAGGGLAGLRLVGRRRRDRQEVEAELAAVRALADEDTTLLGEQLARLGQEHPVEAMDAPTRADFSTALNAYESAKEAVERLRAPDEVSTVVDTLSSGRYALACVEARLEDRPIPELRVPCFFNPQHGPSVRDIVWTAPGRGTRTVPACAQDAARVAAGEQPAVRRIRVGTTLLPYWEAGAAHLPYGESYFAAAVLESGYRAPGQAGGAGGGLGIGM